MPLTIVTYRASQIPPSLVDQIARELVRDGSQTSREMVQLHKCLIGNSPSDLMPEFSMSLATRTNPYADTLDCIGWASATVWERTMCLQAFVAPDYRQMGLATALAAALVVDSQLSQDMPLGVFSDEMARIAVRLKFKDIHRYRRCDDGWIRSERLFDDEEPRPRGVVTG